MLYIYVAAGGAFGALIRYAFSTLLTEAFGKEFPYATLAINVIGSFLLGIVIALLVGMMPRGKELHALLAIGALGGFTTFSTFAYESYMLLEKGDYTNAAFYIIGSVFISILAFFLGMVVFKWAAV